MSDIFLTSDSHFFHKAIIDFQRKDYGSVEAMNEAIIEQWNSLVSDKDEIYHLGDFGFGTDIGGLESICRRLKGKKTLVLGNHETPMKIKMYMGYFRIVGYYKFSELGILLTHMPVYCGERSESGADTKIKTNIHGHIHKIEDEIQDEVHKNICYDRERRIYRLDEFIK